MTKRREVDDLPREQEKEDEEQRRRKQRKEDQEIMFLKIFQQTIAYEELIKHRPTFDRETHWQNCLRQRLRSKPWNNN